MSFIGTKAHSIMCLYAFISCHHHKLFIVILDITCSTLHVMCTYVLLEWRLFFSKSQTNNLCHSLFQSHMLHSFDEFLLFHIMSRSSVLAHFSSGTLGLLGLKGLSFNFSKGGGVGIQFKKKTSHSPDPPTSFLLCFPRPCQAATDPSPSADPSPSDTLFGTL